MKKHAIIISVLCTIITTFSEVFAQDNALYVIDKKISLPGDGGYDYLFIDQQNRRLYVSHGTAVNVIDLDKEELIGTIEGMQGNHGIAIAASSGKGFISDGKVNAVVVFDINTLKTITTIPLSGKKPDAIIYDPFSNQVFAFNGGSDNLSVIDVNALKETTTVALGGGPEFAVTDGRGKIYNNIEDKNSLKIIDSKSLKAINSFPLSPCGGPTGLALDSMNQRLFTVCRENKGMSVIDVNSGKVIATVPIGTGVDAVAYDAYTKLIFCSNGDATTTIVRQESPDKYVLVQTLTTQTRAKTLALDCKTHKIYLSVVDFAPGTKTPLPGSFKLLVYKMSLSR
jgi:YVTN family beta-propeller protein